MTKFECGFIPRGGNIASCWMADWWFFFLGRFILPNNIPIGGAQNSKRGNQFLSPYKWWGIEGSTWWWSVAFGTCQLELFSVCPRTFLHCHNSQCLTFIHFLHWTKNGSHVSSADHSCELSMSKFNVCLKATKKKSVEAGTQTQQLN